MRLGKLRITWETTKPIDEYLESRIVADQRFWVIRDPLFHATRRIMALNHKVHEATLSATNADLMALAESGTEAVTMGDLGKCGFLFHMLKSQLDIYCTERTLFGIANCIILVDGEPFEKMTVNHSNTKQHLFDTIPEVRAFFFNTAHRFLVLMSMVSEDTDVVAYLKSRKYKSIDGLFTSWLEAETKKENGANSGNYTSKKTSKKQTSS